MTFGIGSQKPVEGDTWKLDIGSWPLDIQHFLF